jgi:hypothetical protein
VPQLVFVGRVEGNKSFGSACDEVRSNHRPHWRHAHQYQTFVGKVVIGSAINSYSKYLLAYAHQTIPGARVGCAHPMFVSRRTIVASSEQTTGDRSGSTRITRQVVRG